MTDGLGNTWNNEWNLVCDKKYLKIVAEMIFLMGVATGGIISGMLSDKFGRKKMLFISATFQSFFGKQFKTILLLKCSKIPSRFCKQKLIFLNFFFHHF